ncbi:MAG: lipocalin family protein [Oscillospiraceae bacterium]|nr:lipocalin family protein [Oscillospiraceae bacterium]
MKKFKNAIIVLLTIVMTISLVGCGNTGKVKKQLSGSWGYQIMSINGPCYQFYIFSSDNTYQKKWVNENAPKKNSESEGTYKIEGTQIILTESDGDIDTIIEYSLENDTLKLTDTNSDGSGNHKLTRIE